jgi:hypothetical protein
MLLMALLRRSGLMCEGEYGIFFPCLMILHLRRRRGGRRRRGRARRSSKGKRPARLANEEFVVPADVVSHLGNGSSDAGAKQLYAMMDKVRTARTGRKSQGREINPSKFMPAYA